MTDPLSVTASVVGLVAAANQVRSLLQDFISGVRDTPRLVQHVMNEVHSITSVFHSLQTFLSGDRHALRSREALLMVNDLVITLTGCVCTFSDLQTEIKGLKPDNNLNILDRAKWASKQGSISQIFDRLQTQKSSLTLMLTVLQCKSDDQVERALDKLSVLVNEVLESNRDVCERLERIETRLTQVSRSEDPETSSSRSVQRSWIRATTATNNKARFTFENVLRVSKVYRRALLAGKYPALSTAGSINTPVEPQSVGYQRSSSALSLSDISDISAINLPIFPRDILNSSCYTFGIVEKAAADRRRKKELERVDYYTLVASIGCWHINNIRETSLLRHLRRSTGQSQLLSRFLFQVERCLLAPKTFTILAPASECHQFRFSTSSFTYESHQRHN